MLNPIRKIKSYIDFFWIKNFSLNERPKNPVATIAFNALPIRSSWGGGNQWMLQMIRALQYSGFKVVYDLNEPQIDIIMILHSGNWMETTFNFAEIKKYKELNPRVKVIHRVNDNDVHRGSTRLSPAIQEMNSVADHTVFISQWLKELYSNQWFDPKKSHQVIWNGADSRYFHAIGGKVWDKSKEPFLLVTHHWSSNWHKGFDVYQKIDEAIAQGRLKNIKLVIVGRWPKEIEWKTAVLVSPRQGESLAAQLRQAHGYVTASRAESGGMHFIEGLQCGLPMIFHKDGGGICEMAKNYKGIEFDQDPITAVETLMTNYDNLRKSVVSDMPSGEKMTLAYIEKIKELLS